MGLFNNDKGKGKLVDLQNIVLNTDEKKLQVSEEFLEKMTKIYISKRMKAVNEMLADMPRIKVFNLIFKKYDAAMTLIDELIRIEDLYKFNDPVPSKFKVQLENSLEGYINAFITREWRTLQPGTRPDVNSEAKLKAFFENFEPYKERLSEKTLETIKNLHDSVFPPPPEETQPTVNEETSDGVGETGSDSFVPEEFEHISLNTADDTAKAASTQ